MIVNLENMDLYVTSIVLKAVTVDIVTKKMVAVSAETVLLAVYVTGA